MPGEVRPTASERLLAALTDAVLRVRDGRVVNASHGAERAVGSGGPLDGVDVRDLVHPDDAVPAPGAPPATVRMSVPRGGYHWCEVTCVADDATLVLAVRDVEQRVERERGLLASRRRLLDALDASLDGFGLLAAERAADGTLTGLRMVAVNPAGAQSFDQDRMDLLGRDLLDVFPASRENGLWDAVVRALETGEPVRVRIERATADGPVVEDGVAVRLDADTVVTSWRDVSEVVRQQELLARAYEDAAQVRTALEAALEATSDSFAVYGLERGPDGEVTRVVVRLANTAAAVPLGYDPDQLRGRDLLDVFPELRTSGLWDVIVASAAERRPRRHRVHIDDENGAWVASFDNTVAPLDEDQVVVIWRDVTLDEQGLRDLERTRRQAEHAAAHDHLTGLPNRSQLERRLLEALRETTGRRQVAVIFCDLDGFKEVNDSYGHSGGDVLLQQIARRLLDLTRADDTAARLAGDEFVLVLRDLPERWRPDGFLARADRMLRRPVDVGAGVVTPSASLGVVVVRPSTDGRTPEAILAEADRAMYAAKRARGLRGAGSSDLGAVAQ